MWQNVTDQVPWLVEPGQAYFFRVVVPGSWSIGDVRAILSGPSQAGAFQIQSVHPGHVSGMFRSWEVLASWQGPASNITDTSDISYAAKYAWVPDAQSQAPTVPPPPLPPDASLSPPSTPIGSIVVVAALALALGYGAFVWLGRPATIPRTRPRRRQYA